MKTKKEAIKLATKRADMFAWIVVLDELRCKKHTDKMYSDELILCYENQYPEEVRAIREIMK